MPQESLEDVVQVLRNRLGVRLDGSKADGRDDMIRALEDTSGFSRQQATDAVDALIETGEVAYHMQRDDADTGAIANPIPLNGSGVVVAPLNASGPAVPQVSEDSSNGYWRLGRDTDDLGTGEKAPMLGRTGQVDPTS